MSVEDKKFLERVYKLDESALQFGSVNLKKFYTHVIPHMRFGLSRGPFDTGQSWAVVAVFKGDLFEKSTSAGFPSSSFKIETIDYDDPSTPPEAGKRTKIVDSKNMPIWAEIEQELHAQIKYKKQPAFGNWQEFLKEVFTTLTLKAFVEARKSSHLINEYHVDLGTTPTSNADFFSLVADQTGIVYLVQFPAENFKLTVFRSFEYFRRTKDNEVKAGIVGKLASVFAALRGVSR